MFGKVRWPPWIVDEKNGRQIVSPRACHGDERRSRLSGSRIRASTLAGGTAATGLNGRLVAMARASKNHPGDYQAESVPE